MHALREMQLAFAAEVFGTNPTGVTSAICSDGLAQARRLQVYRNNAFTSLTEALRDVYPVIHRLVGEEFFKQAARGYIRRHPSRSGNLHDFGDRFAQFLVTCPGARQLHYLPDVARLEWAYHEVFHAAEAGALDVARLAGFAQQQHGRLRFGLQPASRLLASPYPVLRIWQVNQDDYAGDSHVNLNEGGVRLLIIRRALDVEIETLSAGEFMLLRALRQGRRFAEACAQALAVEPQIDLPMLLQKHIINRTLVEVSL